MDDLTLQEIRKGVELQFRYKFYQDSKYPFLPAMGIKHIFQGFDAHDDGYIGTLHLWYVNDSGEPSYHTKDKKFVSGIWKGEWIDNAIDAVERAMELENESYSYTEQLTHIHLNNMKAYSDKLARELIDKKVKKQMDELEEESEDILLN